MSKRKTRKALSCLLVSGLLVSVPAVHSQAAVITSNATDKVAVVFQENTAYSAGDYVIYDGEMYICTDDTQGAWDAARTSFMQITKNKELGTSEDLSASYDASADPSGEKSLMAFAANAWQKLKGFFGMESKDEQPADANQYKNASVSGKLNYLQQQNQQMDQSVANLQDWVSRSFSSVSNGKSTLAATITDRGVQVGAQDSFQKFDQAIRDLALLQYNNGQNQGRADGLKEGYNNGRADGLTEGYNNGRADGLKEGYDNGHAGGLKEGYDNGYSAGVAFADSNVNENSASYKKGLSVFEPQIWSTEIRITKDGPDKEEDCFESSEGITSNHIEYTFHKSFKGHTIIAVYLDARYDSVYGDSKSEEMVVLIGDNYYKLTNAGTEALSVSLESIFWGTAAFLKSELGAFATLKFKVVYL